MLFNQINCISNTAKNLLHHLGLAQLILQGVQILMRQLGIVRDNSPDCIQEIRCKRTGEDQLTESQYHKSSHDDFFYSFTNSTLRFNALLAGVSLGATGEVSPAPSVSMRDASIPNRVTSSFFTDSARR